MRNDFHNKRIKIRRVGTIDIEGNIHKVNFHEGLNIITGSKSTGKSTILGIIDFCFGAKKDRGIPQEIREITKHHFIECYSDNENKGFIISRNHLNNKFVLFNLLEKYSDNSIEELINSSKRIKWEQFNGLLFSKSGLPLQQFSKGFGYDRMITYRNCVSFINQPAHLVTSNDYLLYRTENIIKKKSIVEELPILIGKANFSYYDKISELSVKTTELKRVERRIDHIEKSNSLDKIDDLINQLNNNLEVKITMEEDRNLLEFQEQSYKYENFDGILALENSKTEIISLKDKLRELEIQIINFDKELLSLNEKKSIIGEMRNQLISQEDKLIVSEESINSKYFNIDKALVDSFEKSRKNVNLQMKKMNTVKNLMIEKREWDILKQKNVKETEYKTLKNQYIQLSNQVNTSASFLERQKNVVKLVAEIELEFDFLEKELTSLRKEKEKLESRIKILRLETKLETDEVQHKMSLFNNSITEYLDTEMKIRFPDFGYKDKSIGFDLSELNIYHGLGEGKIYLSNWGSDHNYLFAHVCTVLAIQYTISTYQNSVIPAFVLFDQISRAYFPDTVNIMDSEDTKNLNSIYSLINEVINESLKLGGGFQVIAIDHANDGMSEEFINAKIKDDNGRRITFNNGRGYFDKSKFKNISLKMFVEE